MSSLAVGVDKQVYGLSEAIMLIELSGYFLSYRILESSGGSSVSQNKLPQLILGLYLHFKIPSKQLHWLDFILLKFITYGIVIKLF